MDFWDGLRVSAAGIWLPGRAFYMFFLEFLESRSGRSIVPEHTQQIAHFIDAVARYHSPLSHPCGGGQRLTIFGGNACSP